MAGGLLLKSEPDSQRRALPGDDYRQDCLTLYEVWQCIDVMFGPRGHVFAERVGRVCHRFVIAEVELDAAA